MTHTFWPNRFAGQTAIVTGGAKGLGQAIAWRLAKEGADVTIVDVDQEALTQAVEGFKADNLNVSAAMLNITDEKAVEKVFGDVTQKHGRLDAVVNSAAIIGPNGSPATEVDVSAFSKVLEVNVTGSFIVAKQALKFMTPRKYGRILLLASIAGRWGNPRMAPYVASKGAVIAMAKGIAKEFAGPEWDITVNTLAPTTVDTPMVRAMDPKVVQWMKDQIPKGAFGTPDSIGEIASFYLSPAAHYITGQCIDHSGGRSVIG
jgi:3-oxoacyl-[acyl-carrier protein] reductase